MPHRTRRLAAVLVPAVAAFAVAAGGVQAIAQTTEPTDAAEVREPLGTERAPQPARGLIVKLDDAARTSVDELVDDVAAELPGGVAVADAQAGTPELGLLSLSEEVDARDLDDAIAQLEERADVEWAVPNGVRMPTATASDPYYGQLWNLHGTWGVRANEAWDVTAGAASVRVAVVDTGIRSNHPDLQGRLVAGRDFVDDEYRCLNNACTKVKYRKTFISANDGNSWDTNPSDPGDWRSSSTCGDGYGAGASTWHGTHVAGTVAAARNGIGVVGVAPGVKVQPVRALGRCGGTDWDVAMGVLWASGAKVNGFDRRHGTIKVNPTPAKVINLSLGGAAVSLRAAQQACRVYSDVARQARARGAILIAAAGNEAINQAYNVPSSCSGYLSVAATTKEGTRASYSNYGDGIDLAAPGGSGTRTAADNILSTFNDGATAPGKSVYGYMAGTSMAAPVVSGVAALAHSVGITHPDVVARVLKATARRSGCSVQACGAGIVDAKAVVTVAAPLSAPRISGSARPGRVLRATTGTWRNAPSGVQLAWYRNGRLVTTGPAYRVSKADLGQTVAVVSRAFGGNPQIFHRATVVPKTASKTRFSMPGKVKKSKRVTIKVKVAASYVRPTGTVRVYDGTKRIATKRLYAKNRGAVKVKLPKLKKGKHRIRVVYAGSAKVSASSRSKVVRSR